MNLIYDSTQEALKELVHVADTTMQTHNIALDYDGEVIMDPELHYPDVDLKRYKFCTTVITSMLKKEEVLQVLQETLMTVFEAQNKEIGLFDNFNVAA
jgi:hypothetical protein